MGSRFNLSFPTTITNATMSKKKNKKTHQLIQAVLTTEGMFLKRFLLKGFYLF